MAYTRNLELSILPENQSRWKELLNTNILTLESATQNLIPINVSSQNVLINDYVFSNYFFINLTGGDNLEGSFTIEIPRKNRLFYIKNSTSKEANLLITGVSSSKITIDINTSYIVYSDGIESLEKVSSMSKQDTFKDIILDEDNYFINTEVFSNNYLFNIIEGSQVDGWTVVIPNFSKKFMLNNRTSNFLNIKISGASLSSESITANSMYDVYSDGTSKIFKKLY